MADMMTPGAEGQPNSPLGMLYQMQSQRMQNAPKPEERQAALQAYQEQVRTAGTSDDLSSSLGIAARGILASPHATWWEGAGKELSRNSELRQLGQIEAAKLEYDDIVKRDQDASLKNISSMGRSMTGATGYEFRKNSDGTTSVYSKATGAPVGTYGPQDIGKISQMTQVLAKAAFEKGDYTTLDEALQWAQTEAMKQVGGMNQAAGNRTSPLAGNVGGLPTTAAPAPVQNAVQEQAPGANFDLTGMGAEDRDLVQRLIARYKANPNEGTRKQLEQSLISLHGSGALKFAEESTAPPAAPLAKKDIPKEKEREATLVGDAKTAQESFNKDIVEPARAFANTAKIMSDFNHLSKMEEAAKSGKVGELLAGETGKWLAAALPAGADLNATITNAQQREKLTSGMINQILMAAKGIQTEGDAQRARSQVTSIGTNPDANAYLEAYMKETSRQLQLRESMGRAYAKRENTYSGHDADWNASPIMREAVGSVKKLGDNWIGLTQYMDLYKQKHGGSDKDAVASWNKVK